MSLKRKGLMMSVLVVIYAIIAVGVICPLGCGIIIICDELNELKELIGEVVEDYPMVLTWNTRQQENALYNKIDAVIMMVEEGSYMGAAKKLGKDISPKLIDPSDDKSSWLSDDPALQPVVEEFAGTCQGMINDILIALNRLKNG